MHRHTTTAPVRDHGRPIARHGLTFDYERQAWLRDGRYIACGHLTPQCPCFGTRHAGRTPEQARDYERVIGVKSLTVQQAGGSRA